MYKFAVISFPGTNCETEAVRAFKRNGMDAVIVLWNDPGMLNKSRLDEFAGYCIAGGFSYEDRGRSGIIAAQDPITEILKAEADKGKVILGICNGAQILVETGLVPGFENKALGMALSWNEMRVEDTVVDTGFYCDWAYLKNVAPKKRSAFNDFDELLHIPFAHGEGRFVMEKELLEHLEANNQILFKYSDKEGEVNPNFPLTPNGSMASIAGLCNPAGNVMAIMPHPERDPKGNGNLVFQSIKNYLQNKPHAEYKSLGRGEEWSTEHARMDYDLEIYVRFIITDNAERTIEEALIRKGLDLNLERYEFYGIKLKSDQNLNEAIKKIIESGEVANFNKHLVYVKTKQGFFQYNPDQGLISISSEKNILNKCIIVFEEGGQLKMAKKEAIDSHSGKCILTLEYGTLWNFKKGEREVIDLAIKTKILHNPYSMYYVKYV